MRSLILIFLLACCSVSGQTKIELPAGFKEKTFQHVQDMVGFGIRNAGTESEKQTVGYLLDFYKKLHLNPQIDTFGFEYFSAGSITVFVNDQKITYKTIYLDPYKNSQEISGLIYCIDGDRESSKIYADSLRNKVVFANEQAEIYRLARTKPIAIVIVDGNEFKKFNNKPARILIEGQAEKKKSVNIYCKLGHGKKKEILLGAHWDSFCGPGADDNASGVSVIMELSRFFIANSDSLPYTVKVVFFGAEELGLLGSKAYTDKHIQDTNSTIFYFNLDCVGDTGAIIADMVTGQKGKCLESPTGLIKAGRDFKNSWSLLDPDNDAILYESETPSWLDEILTASFNSTHHEYRKVRYCGSDHNSFANKGFITTHMGFDGNNVQHCPADNLNQVNKNSLELAGKIVASVIVSAMKKYQSLDMKRGGFDLAFQRGTDVCVTGPGPDNELCFQNANDPCISPDGLKLAFTKSTDTKKDFIRYIKVVDLIKKTETTLNVQNSNYFGGIWSPDNQYLAFSIFLNGSWRLGLIRSDNTGFTVLGDDMKTGLFSPSWMPDSKYIIAHNMNAIFRFDLKGRLADTIDIAGFTDRSFLSSSTRFVYTSDSKQIVFNAGTDETIEGVDGPADAIFVYNTGSKKCNRISPAGMYCTDIWIDHQDTVYFSGFTDKRVIKKIYKTGIPNPRAIEVIQGSNPSLRNR